MKTIVIVGKNEENKLIQASKTAEKIILKTIEVQTSHKDLGVNFDDMDRIGKFGSETPQNCKYEHKPDTSHSIRKSEATEKLNLSHSSINHDTLMKFDEDNGML